MTITVLSAGLCSGEWARIDGFQNSPPGNLSNSAVGHWGDGYVWAIDTLHTFDGLLRYGELEKAARPNIVIILTDDSGYSDPGCYGGEIETPNLNKLAADGLRFRNFYNNARCSPTRASLMTGRDCAHAGFAAGTLGGSARERPIPAYRARLSYALPTIAEVLKSVGYQTLMVGKWHLGGSLLKESKDPVGTWKKQHPGWKSSDGEVDADFNALPCQRGFDRFFGVLHGTDDFFFAPGDRHDYLEGNAPAILTYDRTYTMHYSKKSAPHHGKTAKAFYETDGLTDQAIRMVREASGGSKPPFFLYMAYRAPHQPRQAPQELVSKYLPRYADPAKVEEGRMQGLIREKIWPAEQPYRKIGAVEAGGRRDLAEYQRQLAIHAAMIEKVDENVDRIVQTLRELGSLDNTLVIYLSDNGADMGELSNRPYRGGKAQLWEGGTKTHCIVHWPKVVKPGTLTDDVGWVGDLLPTCVEIAGATYPSEFHGQKTDPIEGRSLLSTFMGGHVPPPAYLFFNDRGQQSVIHQGRWKLLIDPGWYSATAKTPGHVYELYDLIADPGETRDLAAMKPELVGEFEKACMIWQTKCGILPFEDILKMFPTKQEE